MSEADRYLLVPSWEDRVHSHEDISAPQAQDQSKDSTLELIWSNLDLEYRSSMDARQATSSIIFKDFIELLQVILHVVEGERLSTIGSNFLTTSTRTSTYITKATYFTVTSALKT